MKPLRGFRTEAAVGGGSNFEGWSSSSSFSVNHQPSATTGPSIATQINTPRTVSLLKCQECSMYGTLWSEIQADFEDKERK